MFFKEVEKIPERKKSYKQLRSLLTEFVNMGVKYVEVDLKPDEYKSPNVARGVIGKSAAVAGLPVRVFLRDGKIYLENTAI